MVAQSTLRVRVFNWRKYKAKENAGIMGEAQIPLDFVRELPVGQSLCTLRPATALAMSHTRTHTHTHTEHAKTLTRSRTH